MQEALTNARRHAPGAAADVDLHYVDGRLRVMVRDIGPGCPGLPPTGGHGLAGMAERAAAVGGRLRSGPGVAGGFLVEFVVDAPDPAPPAGTSAALDRLVR